MRNPHTNKINLAIRNRLALTLGIAIIRNVRKLNFRFCGGEGLFEGGQTCWSDRRSRSG